MVSDKAKAKTKVFMFPWLAHGHMSPFLELAKVLCDQNFVICLCSSIVNLESIQDEVNNSRYKGLIELVVLNMSTEILPAHSHTTKNLPSQHMHLLKKAFDESSSNFSFLLDQHKPDLLIYDTIQPWAPGIAEDHNIPAVAFIATSATMTTFMIHSHDSAADENYPFGEIYLHKHEELNYIHLTTSGENYYKEKNRFVESIKSSSEILLVKSSREIEDTYLNHLSQQTMKKVVCVGPLVQVPKESNNDNDDEIIQWLDEKEQKSTVFVSFGSEYFLNEHEIKEIAYGLERSCVNFIWVVRFPEGDNTTIKKLLPDSFVESTKPGGRLTLMHERGLVIPGWAPQVRILKHRNTGGFVSHCGWSSVMEAINYNVPIIAVPMHLDQPVNARLLKELQLGVEVKKLADGKLDGNNIAQSIKMVVGKTDRKKVRMTMRQKSWKISETKGEVLEGVVKELEKLSKKDDIIPSAIGLKRIDRFLQFWSWILSFQ